MNTDVNHMATVTDSTTWTEVIHTDSGKTDDPVTTIMKSILATTSTELFGEPETDFMKLVKRAEEEGKWNALLKLILFEINFNMEEHKKEN